MKPNLKFVIERSLYAQHKIKSHRDLQLYF